MPTPPKSGDDTAPSTAFGQFDLDPRLLATVADLGFEVCTPIQARAMGPLLEGRDVVGRARTGSGKTAAFGLPLLQRIEPGAPSPQALVLAPTRELALQVTEALRSYAAGLQVRLLTVYGGAAYSPQVHGLQRGVEVVVGTPGRLIDLQTRRLLNLSSVRFVVIDEADELLRMGFIDDVERLLADTPKDCQVALFSATMPPPIRKVAEAYLKDPVEVQVEQTVLAVDHIEQRWIRVPYYHKPEALERVLRAAPGSTALVFARTRVDCAEAAEGMAKRGFGVEALHGDLSQSAREHVMHRFRSGRVAVLVATDVAARGLDVEHITHVINFDLPDNIESYVHRIGRTGRAGRKGVAISFVTPREERRLPIWERRLKVPIQEITVPSDAEIAALQLQGLTRELGDVLENTDAAGVARGALGRILDAVGWSTEDAATAALSLLAQGRGLSLEAKRDERPPHWARPRQRPGQRPQQRSQQRPGQRAREDAQPHPSGPADRGRSPRRTPAEFEAANEVVLFLATGQRHGVRPADVVGAITNERNISGAQVGRITVLENKCFVGLPRAVAEAMLADGDKLPIRGVEVHIALARPRPADSPAGARPSPDRPSPDRPSPDRPSPDRRTGDRRTDDRRTDDRRHPPKPRPPRPTRPARKPGKPTKPMWAKFEKKARRGRAAPRRTPKRR